MPDQAGAARPAVILIATKQEWATRSLESILAPRGYIVLRSYTARRTLERALRDRPDIIVRELRIEDDEVRTVPQGAFQRATCGVAAEHDVAPGSEDALGRRRGPFLLGRDQRPRW